jgi:hypothetical protein
MSSKDIIISEIVTAVIQQKTEALKCVSRCYWCNFHFTHIKTFHDIECTFELSFGFGYNDNPNHFNVVFKIHHDKMYDDDGIQFMLYHTSWGKFEKFDRPTISILLDKMKEELKKLNFDKLSGMFIGYETTLLPYVDFFSDIPTIKTMGEECPVCQDCITNTKTECGHTLCVPCFQTIKERKDEDGDYIKPCPICREHITYTH